MSTLNVARMLATYFASRYCEHGRCVADGDACRPCAASAEFDRRYRPKHYARRTE